MLAALDTSCIWTNKLKFYHLCHHLFAGQLTDVLLYTKYSDMTKKYNVKGELSVRGMEVGAAISQFLVCPHAVHLCL